MGNGIKQQQYKPIRAALFARGILTDKGEATRVQASSTRPVLLCL